MEKSTEELLKRNVDISYELHYTRQILMKILAHFIAESASYGLHDDVPQNGTKSEWVSKIATDMIKDLNEHYAKVHFTVNEINDITKIIEESKKFI